MRKYVNVKIHEDNHTFLQNMRREVMIENAIHVTYSQIIELSLIELRKNNNDKEIKEKLVHNKRIGKTGTDGIISELR